MNSSALILQDLNQIKRCLSSGYPFVFGFTVYESFESDSVKKTGHATMPGWGERPIGGHAVLAAGYDDARQWMLVRGSWGSGWGIKGYFKLPYAYLIQSGLAKDFCTIRLVGTWPPEPGWQIGEGARRVGWSVGLWSRDGSTGDPRAPRWRRCCTASR